MCTLSRQLWIISFFVTACVVDAGQAIAQEATAAGQFNSFFNGRDLSGWEGDTRFWRVEDGAIIGETTEDNKAEKNTFLIYRVKEFDDFELQFEYQVVGYNSGIQYRSTDQGGFVVKGYQADFEARWHPSDNDAIDKFSGMFFEENGRMFMGQRGQAVIVRENTENAKKPHIQVIGSVGDGAELEKAIKRDGWNHYRVIARGFTFVHIINDRVMSVAIDEDKANRRASGILAFQLHSGPPMQIKIRNLGIR